MIPADLASRLRVLLESSVQPAAQVQEIPAGLPRFEAGDRFSALIQAALPEGSFQALVAGKTVTLALPESARSGDVLELVVTAQRGNTVFARLASPALPQALPGEAQPHPVLSQTGQLISQLLTGRFGENAPTPLSATGMPLTTAPQNASELAGALKQAISSSGLFYESHLRQWVDGKLPLAAVQQEPQAQHPPLSSQTTGALPFGTDTGADPLQPSATQPPAGTGNGLHSGSETDPRLLTRAGSASLLDERAGNAVSASTDSSDGAGKSGISRSVAEPLMPIVQHQLDTLATHQMSWQGQVWPGVQMQWDIFDPEEYASRQQGSEEDDSAKFWRSALRLSMPNLGNVEVQLILSPQGLKISIDTDSQASADDIRGAGPNLQESLEASGVHLLQLKVSKHEPA
jgi:hypothetical protein